MSSGRAGVPSRDQQAFRWLLSGDDDDARGGRGGRGDGSGRGRPGKGGGNKGSRRRSSGGGGKQPYIPGFKLRCEAEAEAAAGAAGPAGPGDELASLQEAFGAALPADLVADVLASCGGDAAAAMEVLLGLAGGGDTAPPPASGEPSLAAAAPPASVTAAAGPCYWDVLPQEIKELVFQQLSLRDLARAARACRQFAAYVRAQRRSLRTVVVPEGVSYTAVRGLVAAFAGASGVSLSRCAAQLRFPHEWEGLLTAVALGEADRHSGTPVSSVSLARCSSITDAAVDVLCSTFAHLRRADLTRCVEVGDGAALRLAAYTRQLDDAAGSEGEWEQEAWEQEGGERQGASTAQQSAAAAASQGIDRLQLSPTAGERAPLAAPAPAMESPDSAVRRIAAQRHAAMLEQSAKAAREQHGGPLSLGLQELCLRETSVSARGTKHLLQPGSATAKSLQVLDVSRCPNIGGDALDLHPRCVLEVLRAAGCNALRSVVIQLPPDAPLRALNLESCRQLHEVLVVAHRLQELSLSHCGQLRHVSLRCRRLREMRAVNCTNLSLEASELHCPELRVLNLFGCRQVDAEGIETVAPSLTKCAHLDLTGCIALPRLLLPDATALQTVSVAGCGVLRQVLLASPALYQFRAAGCSRLMELRLGNVSLQRLDLENCEHLREVQLSEAPAAAARAQAQAEGEGKPKRALVLRGCTSLPEEAKSRLRAAVLGG